MNIRPTAKDAPVSEIAIGDQHENEAQPATRCAAQAIGIEPGDDSGKAPIASPAPLYKTLYVSADEEHAAKGPREMTVANRGDERSRGRPISEAQQRWNQHFLTGPRRSRT